MAYLELKQQDVAIRMLRMFMEQNPNHPLTKEAGDLSLMDSMKMDAYFYTKVDDVIMVADNAGIALTKEQLSDVAARVITHYDESDYNEFILEMINYVKEKS